MKEFTEKLIGRLKEEHEICINQYGAVGGNIPASIVKKCMAITNRLAEEYVPDTNVGNKDGWIPCSEKLPTRYCHCLVTRRNEYEDGFDTGVREDTYVEIEGIWDWQSKHEGLIDEIIAWMPLPKPYREKGE